MPTPTRRHDLDALRVGAFLLLILYHLGMFYVPWDWHVKSSHILPELEPWMRAVNPWRLTLLFVISGAATRFMAAKLSSGALARQRSLRLLVPLLFGILLVVAPQSWAEVAEKNGYAGGFLDFWPRYLSFDTSFGIIVPTYNHLWFVAYLWLYTVVAIGARALWGAVDRLSARLLAGVGIVIVPIIYFGVVRATAGLAWGETHIVWADGYGHLQYGGAFLLGLTMAGNTQVWTFIQRWRTAFLTASLAILGSVLTFGLSRFEDATEGSAIAFAVLREAYAWAVMCALFGYARRYIRTGSPLLTTLTEAVFPFYIIHQTTIVLVGHLLKPVGLPALEEAALILAATVVSCLATYGVARAVPILRLPLGLKPAQQRLRQAATPVTPN